MTHLSPNIAKVISPRVRNCRSDTAFNSGVLVELHVTLAPNSFSRKLLIRLSMSSAPPFAWQCMLTRITWQHAIKLNNYSPLQVFNGYSQIIFVTMLVSINAYLNPSRKGQFKYTKISTATFSKNLIQWTWRKMNDGLSYILHRPCRDVNTSYC